MDKKIDSFIEKRIKEKIVKECLLLKNESNYDEILKTLSNKYEKKLVIDCLNELNITKTKKTDNENKLNQEEKVIKEDIKLNLPKLEIKEKNESKLTNKDQYSEFDNLNYSKKTESTNIKKEKLSFTQKIKKNPRLSIAIIMIILFFISLIFVSTTETQKGLGSCPYVSNQDIIKLSQIFYDETSFFSFMEYEEIIASYFGKDDCMIINRATINKLRNK